MNRILGICILLAILVGGARPLIAQDSAPCAPTQYITQHLDDLAVVCFDPATPETGVYHNADERFPLAATLKIVILAAYAERIDAGEAALDDTFPADALDAYFLPGSDTGAHALFAEEIIAGRRELTLDDLLGGLIVYSSDAVADFLLSRLDNRAIVSLYRRLGLAHTDAPFGMLGLYLVMSNHETGIADPEHLSKAAFWKEHAWLAEKYLTDAAWREAERAYRARPDSGLPDYAVQAAFLSRFGAHGTAAELTALIQAAYSGETLAPGAQEIMRRYLDWPLAGVTPLDAQFAHFGAKSGAWPGVLAATYYTIDHAGQATALTVLLRHIPPEQWLGWLATFGPLQFELDAIRTRCGVVQESLAG
ncbi:MAG: serine hydrolase [Chloroflexota bacterium]|jgi:D-alanyl-D-alanine carboxypeptidase